jgi:hypothetical protein
MTTDFTSERHERIYRETLSCLRRLGFRGQLLQQRYNFNDWFAPGNPPRQAPAAAFGQTPLSYDSACFAVLLPDRRQVSSQILDYRALGAPFAMEVREDAVVPWRVGRDASQVRALELIPADALHRYFDANAEQWSPPEVLRAKNISLRSDVRQLDFIDLGLIPAIEAEVGEKLDRLLREAVAEAEAIYQKRTGEKGDTREVFRLVFRVLAGKILHDRGVAGFRQFKDNPNPADLLSKVADYYRDRAPVLAGQAERRAVVERLWSAFSFQNLSVEVLAYIYENTLIDPQTRQDLGIHSTPRSVARYIVHHLPLEGIPRDELRIVEPCSGHGIFLVAALKRLRDLVPASWDGKQRHDYFVKVLEGYEKDPFAVEVSKLCLFLADFPNHNGWRVKEADVFKSPEFDRSLHRARVVLCNPPFEDFELTHPARREHAIRKPAAVLNKVLSLLPADGLIGFVLPRKFIDGRAFAETRREVLRRFKEVEIVELPDSIFHIARLETCLLLGKAASEGGNQVSVSFAEVTSHDRQRFLHEHAVSRRNSAVKTDTEAVQDLAVPLLGEVWERLKSLPTLSDAATIHRGVEWKQPFDEKNYLSPTPGPGFAPGVNSAERQFACFERPRQIYLSTRPEHRRGNAWDLQWGLPKVVMNAVRVSQTGPWKIAAFTDDSPALYSQNFHCLWPKGAWTTKTIAALLNGPVAAAFVATRETSKHITKTVLLRVPIPHLQPDQAAALGRLVDDYLLVRSNTAAPDLPLWSAGNGESAAKRILLQIDAEILKAYKLPPRLERLLLDHFRGAKRPVPFDFGDYFPVGFTATIPLWQYLSSDFAKCTAEYLLGKLPKITDPALVEMLENAGQ